MMKNYLLLILMVVSLFTTGQNNDCNVTIDILKKVFPENKIKQIENQKVFETTVWENYATIPLTDCHIVNLDSGICAIAFDIFMTDIPENYENMIKEKITQELEINESSKYQGTGERLIQVIFYDINNNTFLGKPEDFPISELLWIDQGYTSPLRTDKIKVFKKVENCTNTILLTIEEYTNSPSALHYIFKYHEGKILTKSLNTCIEKIYEQKNMLFVHHIENCSEVEEEGAVPENVFSIVFRW